MVIESDFFSKKLKTTPVVRKPVGSHCGLFRGSGGSACGAEIFTVSWGDWSGTGVQASARHVSQVLNKNAPNTFLRKFLSVLSCGRESCISWGHHVPIICILFGSPGVPWMIRVVFVLLPASVASDDGGVGISARWSILWKKTHRQQKHQQRGENRGSQKDH